MRNFGEQRPVELSFLSNALSLELSAWFFLEVVLFWSEMGLFSTFWLIYHLLPLSHMDPSRESLEELNSWIVRDLELSVGLETWWAAWVESSWRISLWILCPSWDLRRAVSFEARDLVWPCGASWWVEWMTLWDCCGCQLIWLWNRMDCLLRGIWPSKLKTSMESCEVRVK